MERLSKLMSCPVAFPSSSSVRPRWARLVSPFKLIGFPRRKTCVFSLIWKFKIAMFARILATAQHGLILHSTKKMKNFTLASLICTIALLSGCATQIKMSPTKDTYALDTSKESTVLIGLTLRNDYHPSYQPSPIVLHVERGDASQMSDRLNFIFDREGVDENSTETNYLARISLPPGKYIMRGISGGAGLLPFHGNFFTPLHEDLEVKPNQIEYVGRVTAVVQERKDGELRAGPMIPLLDQAVTGFSGGTWEVAVADNYESDVAAFRTAFPVLEKANVEKAILPPWDKKKALDWWQAH